MRIGANRLFACMILLSGALLSFGSSGVSQLPSAAHLLIVEGVAPQWPAKTRANGTEPYIPDFDYDGFGDVVALSPRYDLTSAINAGSATVLFGKSTGLSTAGNQQLFAEGYEQPNALFGNSAAIGWINDDRPSDLVVGAPGITFNGNDFSGGFGYFTGGSNGLTFDKIIGGDRPGIFLGFNIAVGRFGDDPFYDVLAAAPGFTVNGKLRAGAVYEYSGPSLDFRQRWTLASPNIKGIPTVDAAFGYPFAADFNGDGRDDAAIGSGNADGQRGQVHIIYSGPNGLNSKGNQLVRLSNRTPGDSFGWRIGACYCNDDKYADAVFTAPGFQDGRGAGFFLPGSEKGLTTEGSAVLQSPWAKPGDHFGYDIYGAGVRDMYVFAFGSPDADYNGVQDSGRVDFFDYSRNKWSPFTLGTKNLTGRQFGFSGTFTFNRSLDYFFHGGLPGSTVNGKTDAGEFLSGRLRLGSSITVGNRKFFHYDKLAGTNQDEARFAEKFAIYPIGYWDDDDW